MAPFSVPYWYWYFDTILRIHHWRNCNVSPCHCKLMVWLTSNAPCGTGAAGYPLQAKPHPPVSERGSRRSLHQTPDMRGICRIWQYGYLGMIWFIDVLYIIHLYVFSYIYILNIYHHIVLYHQTASFATTSWQTKICYGLTVPQDIWYIKVESLLWFDMIWYRILSTYLYIFGI